MTVLFAEISKKSENRFIEGDQGVFDILFVK